MTLSKWLRSLRAARTNRKPKRCRPSVEFLETRTVPSTFWVSNRNDSGAGSLRQAVLDANGHAGSDVIKFRNSAEGTITLTSELSVTGELRIDGPGSNRETVSGGGTSRVFNIASGAVVRIDDLTIANGHVQDANGGGILNAGQLTLKASVVTGCSATAIANTGDVAVVHSSVTGNSGAGLSNATGATAAIIFSKVNGNTGVGVGGIFSGGTLTVENSEVNGNESAEFGAGGIFSLGTLTIDDSEICGNVGGYYAGGIRSSGFLTIRDCAISENTGGVGGLYVAGSPGPVWIEDCRISDNSGSFGGGVLGSANFVTNVIHTQICNNTTIDFAAGIKVDSPLNVIDSVISGNVGGYVGGINSYGGLQLIRSIVSGNQSTTQGYGAGGIYGEILNIVDSTVSGNSGDRGGGVYSLLWLTITRSTISGNLATPTASVGFGGVTGYEMVIDNSTISGNSVIADNMVQDPYGFPSLATGGMLAFGGVTIDHSTIAFNSVINAPLDVSQVSGGVIAVSSSFGSADVSIRNSIVATNTATGHDPDVTGPFQSQGHNLIGVLTDNATGFVASDLHGTPDQPLDPRLEPLRWNGGRTRTHALKLNSPAINAGDNADAPATDQRGRDRIVDDVIDIGAYEANFCFQGRGAMAANPDDKAFAILPKDQPPVASNESDADRPKASKREAPKWLLGDPGERWSTMVPGPTSGGTLDPLFVGASAHTRLAESDRDDAVFIGGLV